ncbi:MAG: hypothetical protein KC496_18810, partial [Anaerolineae bacterium]|nr:hypothetical protein [Anaerolineae bacterium]
MMLKKQYPNRISDWVNAYQRQSRYSYHPASIARSGLFLAICQRKIDNQRQMIAASMRTKPRPK